jgi:murein DD-endopeptidase MepM/ murein hydrolase activator NlpD
VPWYAARVSNAGPTHPATGRDLAAQAGVDEPDGSVEAPLSAGAPIADAHGARGAERGALEGEGAPGTPPAEDELGSPGRPPAVPLSPALPSHRRSESAPAAPSTRGGDGRPRSPSTWAGNPRARVAPTWLGAPRSPSTYTSQPSEGGRSALGGLDGARVPPGLVRAPAGAYLSPRMTAVFGGLFGLATLTSIVALLIQGVPVRDERALVAAASSSGSAGSAPEAVKVGAALELKKKKRTALPGPWRITELAKDPSVLIASDAIERRAFITALAEKGIPKAQVYRIMKAFDGLRKFDKCGRRDRFTVAMDRATRRARAFEYQVSSSEIYQAKEDENGLLTGARLDMKIGEEETVAAFYVGKDLAASYRAGGLEDGALETIDEALSGRMSTESFEEGSTVRLIAVEETALGLFSRYKKLIALEYRPADPAQKPLRIYDFSGQESRGYFDERGRQPYAGGWRSPIPGAPVTSKFNPKRLHPVLKKIMPHQGTDFGAPTGTPVYSAYRGVVEWIGPSGPSGNLVTLLHPDGVSTGYAHLSRFASGIRVGDRVGTHQLVGYVGSTGRSTGPHLHFSAKKDGKFFDAETLQLDGERVLPGGDRAAFAAAKEALDQRLEAIPLPEPPPEPVKPEPKEAPTAEPPAGLASAAPVEPAVGPSGPTEPASHAASAAVEDEEGELIEGADLKHPPPSTP